MALPKRSWVQDGGEVEQEPATMVPAQRSCDFPNSERHQDTVVRSQHTQHASRAGVK